MIRPGPFLAATYPLRGMAFLARRRQLWPLAATPFVLNLVLYVVAVVLFALSVPWLFERLAPEVGSESWRSPARVATGVLIVLGGLVVLALSYTAVGALVAAPFLERLARRTFEDLGVPVAGGERSIPAALAQQARQVGVFLAVEAGLLALWIVPILGSVLQAVGGAWFACLWITREFVQVPLECLGRPAGEEFRFLKAHHGASIGFGASILAVSLVPLVGYLVLPAAAVGGALLVRDCEPRGPA